MSVPGRRVLYILLLLTFLGPVCSVWAAGAMEDPLDEAEALVQDLRYNDAILLISEIMRKYPRKFDEAQALLSDIRKAREYYNEKYSDLIEAYQGDLEEAYKIIKELEALDPDPNEATAESLKLAKETAGFVYNNNRFKTIMGEAQKLLSGGFYYEAIGVYTTGFDLSRDIFDDEEYGDLIVSMVNRMTGEMQIRVTEALLAGTAFNALIEKIHTSLETNEPIQGSLAEYRKQSDAHNQRREVLDTLAGEFLKTEEDIRHQRTDDKQVYYLLFMNRLLDGRRESESPEGIVFALQQAWRDRMQETEDMLIRAADGSYGDVLGAYDTGNFNSLAVYIADLSRRSSELATFLPIWGQGLYMDRTFSPQSIGGDIIGEKLPVYQRALILGEVSSSMYALMKNRKILGELETNLTDAESFEAVDRLIRDLAAVDEVLEEQSAIWEGISSRTTGYAEAGGDFSAVNSLIEGMFDRIDAMEISSGDIRLATVDRKAELLLMPLHRGFDQAFREVADGKQYLEGLSEIKGEGDEAAEVVYYYPDKARDLFTSAEARYKNQLIQIDQITAFLEEQEPRILETDTIRMRFDETREIRDRLTEELAGIESLTAEADERIFLAARYRQEGERRMAEARQLSGRNEFAAAKERLEAAAGRFDESLFYQEDPELRELRDSGISRLFSEIIDAENALVIREVREYIIQGKTLYSQGEFSDAQNILLRAENRWNDTNVETNPEIVYWLSLTQTALSVTSGREIDETDPLYAEMSQYLNQARADYHSGKNLIADGKKQDADFYLNRAEKNLLYVQQYFPFNKEARVLNLLISKIRDEKQFQELFKKDFTEAKSLISTNPQKAYIDLKDLEAIDPSYPGMAQAILEAEYAAGIKIRPPDRTKINQAAKLYDDAYRIYSSGNRAQYPLALSLLDEAINLNPDNISAIRLKDTISVETGGRSTSVFSNEDQQVYLEAVNAFTAGNYLKASILVDVLMQNPDNQRNTKLLELQERIETVR